MPLFKQRLESYANGILNKSKSAIIQIDDGGSNKRY